MKKKDIQYAAGELRFSEALAEEKANHGAKMVARRGAETAEWAMGAWSLLEEIRSLLEQGGSVPVGLYERLERALS